MASKKTTRRALFSSLMSLLLCVSMLVGSTFAWFTDSVTSSGNKVVAGNLDVDLYQWTAADASTEITNESEPLFGAGGLAQNDASAILWEPNKTQVVYLSIKNNGSLDLKYRVNLKVENPADGKDLYKVMQYAITRDAKYGSVTAWNGGKNVTLGINDTGSNTVVLEAGSEHFFALSVHMDQDAGNEYQNGQVEFDIEVLATQLNSEEDSFGSDYDKDSLYPISAIGTVSVDRTKVALEVEAYDSDVTTKKVATFNVPTAALADDVESITVRVVETEVNSDVTIQAGQTATTFDVTVSGIKEGNTEPVKVKVFIGKGLDPATVKLYHYDELIDSTYNPSTGYVSFETATFSPFTVVYDAESKYVPSEPTTDVPKATVTFEEQYVNTSLGWGNFGDFTPTPGLDSQLEAAFRFASPEEGSSDYDTWYCDFFVSLDRDLGKDQIFLGGNYGSFGWVGFHNGDLTLDANNELPLLSSVTSNPWTYSDVKSFVSEFLCGVGDVNDALEGATFTVKLRLIDPSKVDTGDSEWWANLDKDSYVNTNVVKYTFGGNSVIDGVTVVTTAEGLQDAVNNGDENIQLGGDLDLSNGGIVIP